MSHISWKRWILVLWFSVCDEWKNLSVSPISGDGFDIDIMNVQQEVSESIIFRSLTIISMFLWWTTFWESFIGTGWILINRTEWSWCLKHLLKVSQNDHFSIEISGLAPCNFKQEFKPSRWFRLELIFRSARDANFEADERFFFVFFMWLPPQHKKRAKRKFFTLI